MSGVDRYTDAIAHIRDIRPRTEAENIALAQVHATLALAAAAALPSVLPLVDGDHEEVTSWARLLLPGFRPETRYSEREWLVVLREETPPMPWGVAGIRLNEDEVGGEPRLGVEMPRMGVGLTPDLADMLGRALMGWAARAREGELVK